MNLVFVALMLACCAYAFVHGGAPERVGAAIFLVGSVVTYVVLQISPIEFQGVEVGVFVVDVVAFFAFVFLALRANRFWPIWVSALLGLGVLGHVARWAGPEVIPWAYAAVLSIWSYPMMAIIAVGTFNHRRRQTRSASAPTPPPGPTL